MKKTTLFLLLALTLIFSGCTTSQPPPAAYTPTPTSAATAAPSVAATPAYEIRFDNFTAHTNGEIRFKAFGKSSYALSDLKWIVRGEEVTDYSKIWLDYDIGTPNTMIRGAAEGQPMYIKTGQSWTAGTPVAIRITEKSSGIVLVDKILIVQQ